MNDSATLNLMVLGYVVGLPVVAYGLFDLTRIPARLYEFTPYSRRIWVAAFLLGYACFGLGAMLMVFAWHRSPERAELRDDAALDQRWERPLPQAGEMTRAMRRRERARRHRWAALAVSLPVVLAFAVAATAIRVG